VTYLETDLVTTIEQITETIWPSSPQSQLDGINQFHGGGADAVERLLPSLGLTPGMTALDAGSGLGARPGGSRARPAVRSSASDTTQSCVDTAMALTHAAGAARYFPWARTVAGYAMPDYLNACSDSW
jgi:hypothetical protein